MCAPVVSDFEPFACSPASYFRVDFLTVTSQTKFSVGLVQMAVSPHPKENLARASSKIEEAGRNGAQVVCLPELFQSQYFCQREDTANFDLAEADSRADDRNAGPRGAEGESRGGGASF